LEFLLVVIALGPVPRGNRGMSKGLEKDRRSARTKGVVAESIDQGDNPHRDDRRAIAKEENR
jgi:hypothetical protein